MTNECHLFSDVSDFSSIVSWPHTYHSHYLSLSSLFTPGLLANSTISSHHRLLLTTRLNFRTLRLFSGFLASVVLLFLVFH